MQNKKSNSFKKSSKKTKTNKEQVIVDKKKSTKNKNIAQSLGSILAHVQSTFDEVFSFGFKKLNQFGQGKKISSEQKKEDLMYYFKKISKITAKFLGQTGEAYYDTYDKLKKSSKKIKKK